jgi:hypothetical protein
VDCFTALQSTLWTTQKSIHNPLVSDCLIDSNTEKIHFNSWVHIFPKDFLRFLRKRCLQQTILIRSSFLKDNNNFKHISLQLLRPETFSTIPSCSLSYLSFSILTKKYILSFQSFLDSFIASFLHFVRNQHWTNSIQFSLHKETCNDFEKCSETRLFTQTR